MIPISAVVLGADEERARDRGAPIGPARAGADGRSSRARSSPRTAGRGTRWPWPTGPSRSSRRCACSGVGPGDEVVTSAFTFVATLNAILECGARARLRRHRSRDVQRRPGVAGRCVHRPTRVSSCRCTSTGKPADMAAVVHDRRSATAPAIVEDAAQAHGASDRRPAASAEPAWARSRSTRRRTSRPARAAWSPPTTTTVADRLRLLRNHGMRARYEYEFAGTNFRLTDVQAAIALPQLARLDAAIEQRQANAARLSAGLAGVAGLITPVVAPGLPARVPPVHDSGHRRCRHRSRRARRATRLARRANRHILPACCFRLRLLPGAPQRRRE